jgi:RNA ligase (TIGR02306 family)
MTDWNPQIIKIEKIEKHPYADTLSVATVLGDYPVVIKTGEYEVGQLAGYLPIDTIVPDIEYFYFLCPKSYEKYEENGEVKQRQIGTKYPEGSVPERYRILKAKKIRNVYSQGMLISLKSFLREEYVTTYNVGTSLVELLLLKKWDEPEEENLPGLKKTGTNAEKAPQGWAIPHYDIDGIRKYVDCLNKDEKIVLTEKLHGSNAAFVHDGTRLWVKSRNHYKKMDTDDMWWDIAIRYDLENKLKFFPNHVFFGEVYGHIKGFRYDTVIEGGVLLTKVRFFDVWDLSKMRYLDYNDRLRMIARAQLDAVPQLYFGPWLGKEEMYSFAEGISTLNPKHIREGWVLNTVEERYEPRLNSRMQVKLVGEGYNLQK